MLSSSLLMITTARSALPCNVWQHPPHVGRFPFCLEVICDSSKTMVSTIIGTYPPLIPSKPGEKGRLPCLSPLRGSGSIPRQSAYYPPLFPRRIGRCSRCPRIRSIRVSAPRHTHDGGIVRDSVLMVSCDCRAYSTPPFPLASNISGGCP